MILVLHGENYVQSRNRLFDILEERKNKSGEIIRFEGKNLTLEELALALESRSLFGRSRTVIIENLFSLKKTLSLEKILDFLINKENEDVVIWEEEEISPAIIKKYSPPFSFQLFKVPKILFYFLENFKPGLKKTNLENFHRCLAQEDAQFIFAMLIRQVRLLLLAKDNSIENLPEWQRKKLFSQARLFDFNTLKKIYNLLMEIDFRQKISSSPFDLVFSLDLLFSEI